MLLIESNKNTRIGHSEAIILCDNKNSYLCSAIQRTGNTATGRISLLRAGLYNTYVAFACSSNTLLLPVVVMTLILTDRCVASST